MHCLFRTPSGLWSAWGVLEELLSAEELEVGVLDPALTQHLIGEVVHVLEDGEPSHRACGKGWAAGAVLVDRPEPLLKQVPVNGSREPHKRMLRIDNLVEPGPEEVDLACDLPLLGPHETPRRRIDATRKSCPASRIILQENRSTTCANRQTRL